MGCALGLIDRGLRKVCDIKFNQNTKSPEAHLLVSIFKIPFCDIIHHHIASMALGSYRMGEGGMVLPIMLVDFIVCPV